MLILKGNKPLADNSEFWALIIVSDRPPPKLPPLGGGAENLPPPAGEGRGGGKQYARNDDQGRILKRTRGIRRGILEGREGSEIFFILFSDMGNCLPQDKKL